MFWVLLELLIIICAVASVLPLFLHCNIPHPVQVSNLSLSPCGNLLQHLRHALYISKNCTPITLASSMAFTCYAKVSSFKSIASMSSISYILLLNHFTMNLFHYKLFKSVALQWWKLINITLPHDNPSCSSLFATIAVCNFFPFAIFMMSLTWRTFASQLILANGITSGALSKGINWTLKSSSFQASYSDFFTWVFLSTNTLQKYHISPNPKRYFEHLYSS